MMLSLPEDWDYTTRGLASICKEGVDSVCATVRELEAAGYIIRRRIRDKNGQMRGMEYTVLEQPQPPEQGPEEAAPMFDRLGRIESETPFVLEWFVQHGIENSRVAEQRIRQESNLQKVKRVAIERLRCLIKQTSQTVMASLPSED